MELAAQSSGVFALPPTPAGEALAVEGEIIRTFPDGQTRVCDGGQIGGVPQVNDAAAVSGRLSGPCARSESPPAVQPTVPFNDAVMIDPATGAVNVSVDPAPYYFADAPREGYLSPEQAAELDRLYGIDDVLTVELFRVVDGVLVPLNPEFQAQPGETVTVEVQRTIDVGYTSGSGLLVSLCTMSATPSAPQPTPSAPQPTAPAPPTTEISGVSTTPTTTPVITGSLPVTGSTTGTFLLLAGLLLAAGAAAMLLLIRQRGVRS